MFDIMLNSKYLCNRRRQANAHRSVTRRNVYHRRLLCEPLEDRQLLSVGVSGMVWSDLDQDGIQAVGEPGIAGAVVEMFSSTDDTVGNGDDVSRGTAITDDSGNYSFTDLPDGLNYYEVFRTPVGYTFTAQVAGEDDSLDSDADASGMTAVFAIVAGETDATRDAGLIGDAPDFGFALRAGAPTHIDTGQSVALDSAGNVLVAGYFWGTADFDPGPGTCLLTSASQYDTFVAKYSSAGALVWARNMGGTGGDYANGIAVADDGSVYTTGYFYDTADFDPSDSVFNLISNGGSDVFVSKLDAAGNFIWAGSMGGSDDECAYGIAVADDGSVCTTGYFSGTADFNPGTGTFNLISAGGDDIFVSMLDSVGDFVWAASMGSSSYDYGNGIAVTSDGDVCVTGSFEGTADFDPGAGTVNLTSVGSSDIFTVKLDSTGDFIWAAGMGGSEDDYGNGIAVSDDDGSVYTTGYFLGTADFDPGLDAFNLASAGGSDVFVAKLDSAGNFAWARSMGGDGYDEGNGVTIAGDGGVCLTGHFYDTADFDPNAGTFNLVSVGSSDIFVAKLDSSGNLASARSMGGDGYDEGNGIAVADNGSIYTTGDFYGVVDFDPGAGTFNLTSAGNSDIYVSKLLFNCAPTDITLSVGSIAENQPSGAVVGTFNTTDPNSNDTFAYALVAGDGSSDNALFTIDGDTLQTTTTFDYEAQNSYSVRVRSTDQDGLWTEKVFTINVTDVNEAPTDLTLLNDSVAENQPSGTVVGTFDTTDPDTGDTFIYSLVAGEGDTDNALFAISGDTLQTAVTFDYEVKNSYHIRVRSTDQGGLYTEKTFTITVTDANDQPADILLSGASAAEDQPIGTEVGTFDTTDLDTGNSFTYSLVSGAGDTDNGAFTINGSVLETAATFDYETKSAYDIRVRSTDQGGLYTEKTFTITVTDVNEQPTDIGLSSSSVSENEPSGATVGAFNTADPDAGNTFTYALVSGSGSEDNASFTINGDTLVTAGIFDYETKSSYNICVRSTDQNGLYTEEAFVISVTNVNEQPTDIGLSNTTVPENQPSGTAVGAFSTVDPDSSNTFTYTLVSGSGSEDNAFFAISGAALETAASFDYEAKSVYNIRVRSTDQGGLWMEEAFTVSTTNVNEAPTDLTLSNDSVAENQPSGTAVGTLGATDPDSSNTFTYNLVAGEGSADNASFTISGDTLQTADSFDYETKNVYNIRIRLMDQGGLWTEETFAIAVTDVNESPTDIFLTDTSVPENASSGTVVGTFSTTDQDGGNTFTYSLVAGTGDTDNASFTISGDTLQTATTFDYESKNSYSIRVRSTDQVGSYTDKVFVISVTNANEQPTDIFLSNASVAENQVAGAVVGELSATDPDANNTFTYTLVSGVGSTDNGLFTINGDTLQTAAVFNYEAENSYSVRVRSTDQDGLYTEKTFTIGVTDVDEQPSDIGLTNANVSENQPLGTEIGILSTADPDAGNTFTFSLVSGSGSEDNASFAINGDTLQTAATFNYESESGCSIRIRSTDQAGLYTEKAFTISVTDVNEQPTDISLSNASVAENQAVGAVVGALSTVDQDAGDTFLYTLVGGDGSTDNASFTISDGTLQAAATFDYEGGSSYSIRVRSTDQGGLYTERTFTISVTNVNEQPTNISLSNASVAEEEPAGTEVGTFSTTDPDNSDTFTYSLASGTGDMDNVGFTIDDDTLETSASFDYETKDVYNIRVRSTDQGGLWTEETFTISVTDVVEPPQGIVLSTDNMTVPEGGTAQFTVKLNAKPHSDVNVAIAKQSGGDVDLSVSPSSLTFTPSDWNTPQTVTLVAWQDADVIDGTADFVASSSDLTSQTIVATEQDDDTQGLVVSANSLSVPEGGTSQFTVKLNAQPQLDVTVAVAKQSGDEDLSADVTDLIFTSADWDTPQAVTISASQDADTTDDTASFLISSSGLPDQTITASEQDDDVQGQGTWQDTIGLLAPTPSKFYLRNTNDAGHADLAFPYGPANGGWKPIAGDWDSDGTGTIGSYNPANSKFFLRNTNDAGCANVTFAYGPANAGWLPIAGDWDGDGTDTIGLYNPTTSKFFLRNTNDAGYADVSFYYGPANAGWLPIAGDWDGDGTDTIGLYNPTASKYFLRNSNTAGVADVTFYYGPANAGWLPIAGDWNADGTDTIGLYNPATSKYFQRNTNTAGRADVTFAYGPANAGWLPIAGDWNGSASTLRAAGGAIVTTDVSPLTNSILQPFITEAIARWAAVGLSTSSLSMFGATNFVIADLSSSYLGQAEEDTIYLDRDAAGHGWFIDPTPADDLEFDPYTLSATVDSPAADRADLLTTVMHEMGHLLGYDHTDDGLMSAILPLGVRRLAAVDEVFASLAHPV